MTERTPAINPLPPRKQAVLGLRILGVLGAGVMLPNLVGVLVAMVQWLPQVRDNFKSGVDLFGAIDLATRQSVGAAGVLRGAAVMGLFALSTALACSRGPLFWYVLKRFPT